MITTPVSSHPEVSPVCAIMEGTTKDGPGAAENGHPEPDLPPASTDKEALVTISPLPSDTSTPSRHWFVPSGPEGYYCAACNLPRRNRRHAVKAAA